MQIHELEQLTDIDHYHAAQALIDDLLDSDDPESLRRLDKLFDLVSNYEMDNWGSDVDALDFDQGDYDNLEWY